MTGAQGTADMPLLPGMTEKTADELAAAGTDVTFKYYDGADHDTILAAALPDLLPWVAARFSSPTAQAPADSVRCGYRICQACIMASSAARRLLLLRHAKSAWPGVADHERPLAPRGRRDAPAVGRWLQSAGQIPDRVVCSTARRARETWQLAAAELGATPRVSFDQRVYGAAADGLLDLARETAPGARALLIVGHDPALQELTLALASTRAGDADALERVRFKFPTAAIAVLEFTGTWQGLGPGQAQLTAFVVPRELRTGSSGG